MNSFSLDAIKKRPSELLTFFFFFAKISQESDRVCFSVPRDAIETGDYALLLFFLRLFTALLKDIYGNSMKCRLRITLQNLSELGHWAPCPVFLSFPIFYVSKFEICCNI